MTLFDTLLLIAIFYLFFNPVNVVELHLFHLLWYFINVCFY